MMSLCFKRQVHTTKNATIKNSLVLAILVSLAAATPAAAGMITLDFESGAFSNEKGALGNGGNVDTYSQDGYTLTTVSAGNAIYPTTSFPLGALDFFNMGAPVYASNNDNDLILTFGGAAFDLKSIDILFLATAEQFDLIPDVGTPISIARPVGSGGGWYGTHSLDFQNVTSVVISVSNISDGGLGSGSVQTIDNLVVQTASPVPEPSSMILIGTGLLGICGYARRRRSTARAVKNEPEMVA